MEIVQVRSDIHLQQVRELFLEYFEFLRKEHGLELEYQGIAKELAALPGSFAPPEGRLVMAVESDSAMGCAALRRMEAGICELKRMYVRPEFSGRGIGRALANQLIQEARDIGYTRMRLDTGNFLLAAQNLYHSLGFKPIEPYHDIPEDMQREVFFI